jgi:aldehyde dehydrogenase (NAD+)
MIDAIAAGNTVIVYISPYVPHTNKVLKKIINVTFASEYVEIVDFKQTSYKDIMIPNYDYVFFTGSTRVGRIISAQLADRLIPVTLELGGKSPCIVDRSANLDIAAKRIIRGKLMNSGQTCIAPDYFLIHVSIKELFVSKLIHYIEEFYGKDIVSNQTIPKIINKLHFDRLTKAITGHKIIFGGNRDSKTLIFEPTIIEVKELNSQIMSEEIFGPLIPIITFNNVSEIFDKYKPQVKPLALYIFSKDKKITSQILNQIQSGGCCINDTIMHTTNPNLPFGGIGNSGMGSYHGIYGFRTFSHYRALIKTGE